MSRNFAKDSWMLLGGLLGCLVGTFVDLALKRKGEDFSGRGLALGMALGIALGMFFRRTR